MNRRELLKGALGCAVGAAVLAVAEPAEEGAAGPRGASGSVVLKHVRIPNNTGADFELFVPGYSALSYWDGGDRSYLLRVMGPEPGIFRVTDGWITVPPRAAATVGGSGRVAYFYNDTDWIDTRQLRTLDWFRAYYGSTS